MTILKRKNTQFTFDEGKGVLASLSFQDVSFLTEHGSPLFVVAMREKNEVTEYPSTAFTFVGKAEEKGKTILSYALEAQALVVRVYLALDEEGGLTSELSIENGSKKLIDYVDLLPITVYGKLAREGGKGRVLYPFNEGAIYDDLEYRLHSGLDFIPPQCPSRLGGGVYPNMVESQFIGYLLDGYGLYMGMHDETFAPKGIDFYRVEEGMRFMLRYFGGLNYGESMSRSCPAYIRPFEGDWLNAADLYKAWYDEHRPAGLQKLCDNPILPKWFDDSPTIIIYPVRGSGDAGDMTPNKLYPYQNAMRHIDRLAEETGGKILALLMHWEGTAPWNAPYVWPPFGGEALFCDYVKALHEKGHLVGVYCSGLAFTQQSLTDPNYNQDALLQDPDIIASLCVQPDGQLAKSLNVQHVRRGYDLCIKGKKTREIMAKEVRSMVDAGIDFIQILDQNHGGNACFCYSDRHGHPVGQGAWQVDELRAMLADFAEIAGDKTVFGCESTAADPFLQVLNVNDARYQVNYIGGASSIPLTSYLYHEYLNNFMGNGCWTGIVADNDFLLYRIAYSFVAGDMLALVINEDGQVVCNWEGAKTKILPDRVAVTTLIKQMNALRREQKEYLIYGRIVRAKTLEFGGLKNSLQHSRSDRKEVVDKLLTGRFQAGDGSERQFVVNYNGEPIAFSVEGQAEMLVYGDGKVERCTRYVIPPYGVIAFA